MNDNDNILSFPTDKRKEEVRKDRIDQQGFTVPAFNQLYNYDTITFNFDSIPSEPIYVPMNHIKIDYSPVLNQPTKLERMMDRCNDLQKRIVYHVAKDNDQLLKMIDDKIQEALDLANLNKNI
jgi:hypothetical protein